MAKRILAPKIRNNNTMSESAFWGFIRSTLRRKSMFWRPVAECRKACRRNYKGDNKRQLYEYQCIKCKKWKKGTDIVVDHINPVGTLLQASDLPNFVETLFCEKENLQCMCKICHNTKTKKDNIITKQKRNESKDNNTNSGNKKQTVHKTRNKRKS